MFQSFSDDVAKPLAVSEKYSTRTPHQATTSIPAHPFLSLNWYQRSCQSLNFSELVELRLIGFQSKRKTDKISFYTSMSSSEQQAPRPARPSRNLSSLSLKNSSVPHFISSTTHDASVDYLDRPTIQRTASGAHDAQITSPTESGRSNVNRSTIGEEDINQLSSQLKKHFKPYGGGATDAPVTVIDSSIAYTINHKNCQPAQEGFSQVVATLFYVGKNVGGTSQSSGISADQNYGQYVSQAALFDFINTWDNLVVPWKKWDSSHRCLENSEQARVVELTVVMPEMLNLEDLRRHEDIAAFEQKWNIQVVIQRSEVARKHKRLAVFDMDSTLIQQEVIDEIARYVGVEKEVSVS